MQNYDVRELYTTDNKLGPMSLFPVSYKKMHGATLVGYNSRALVKT